MTDQARIEAALKKPVAGLIAAEDKVEALVRYGIEHGKFEQQWQDDVVAAMDELRVARAAYDDALVSLGFPAVHRR
jgi:hypothetical protein